MTSEEFKAECLLILSEVDAFCKHNNINYSLAYGTMIGAIRHKGFIPWDDDIDILMLREDYDRFVSMFNQKASGRFYVASSESDCQFPYAFAKICDNHTICNDYGYDKHGVGIDLFPIDKLPMDDKQLKELVDSQHRIWYIFMIKMLKWRKDRSFAKNVFAVVSAFFARMIPYSYLHKKLKANTLKYKDILDYRLGCLYSPYGMKDAMDKSIFSDFISVDFEDYKFSCLNHYDDYLRHLYGDYMKLPPVDQQVSHHDFEAYWNRNE